MYTTNLFPLIVPNIYLNSSWKPPHQKFPNNDFVLTWIKFEGSSAMNYLTELEYKELDQGASNWQQQSFENLRHSSDFFHTDVKFSSQDNSIVFISFLNNDGIGSSRVLLNFELSNAFQKGYYIAFPDRSCGLVLPKGISTKAFDETKALIEKMYKVATTPMSNKIYDSTEFLIPEIWTSPVNKKFSKQIIDKLITIE